VHDISTASLFSGEVHDISTASLFSGEVHDISTASLFSGEVHLSVELVKDMDPVDVLFLFVFFFLFDPDMKSSMQNSRRDGWILEK
jgi:hypothetical protein